MTTRFEHLRLAMRDRVATLTLDRPPVNAVEAVGADPDTAAFARTLLGEVRFAGGRWTAEPATTQAAEGR